VRMAERTFGPRPTRPCRGRAGRGAALSLLAALAALASPVGRAPAAPFASPPPLVRPPAPPWTLANTAPGAPAVSWTGPSLVVADSPEVLTPSLLARAGGAGRAHLLYADRSPRLTSPTWVFAYVRSALAAPIRVWLAVRPLGGGRGAVVRYARAAVAAVGRRPLAVGREAAFRIAGLGAPGWGEGRRLASGERAVVAWRLMPGELLCLWWPVRVTGPGGRPAPFALSLWVGPGPGAPPGRPLPPGPGGVVRTTVPHAVADLTLTAPVHGAVAYDLDNDAPTPAGVAGGYLCPPWVCANGEVTTWGGAPFARAADPLPGEAEAGVDALDAPDARPAVAVPHDGGLLRTGNYGDYGARLTLTLRAPAGRRVWAALVPGFARPAPWVGATQAGGRAQVWALPQTLPPPGLGWQVVAGAEEAILTSAVTPGAYAPWRIVLWSTPAP
jgi:hypothetical protein